MRPREDQGPDWSSDQEQVDDMEQAKTSSSSLRLAVLTVVLTSISGRTIAKLPVPRRQENVHSHIWYGVGGSSQLGLEALDRYMPRIKAQTPKGSIVALITKMVLPGIWQLIRMQF